jgi:glutathione S-transferase
VDGDFIVYESDIICEYLARRFDWQEAYGPDLQTCMRMKLAMKQWDQVIMPATLPAMRDGRLPDQQTRDKIDLELGHMSQLLVLLAGDTENMLALHLAPFWARMGWLRQLTPFAELIDAHEELRYWLDRTLVLPCIQSTLPNEAATVSAYRERFCHKD